MEILGPLFSNLGGIETEVRHRDGDFVYLVQITHVRSELDNNIFVGHAVLVESLSALALHRAQSRDCLI